MKTLVFTNLGIMRGSFLAFICACLFVCFLASCQKNGPVTPGSDELGPLNKKGTPSIALYGPNAKPYGKSFTEWEIMWWKWVMNTSQKTGDVVTHPMLDETGEYFMKGQDMDLQKKVIFLGGYFGTKDITRTITVGVDNALFFPIMNAETDNMYMDPLLTDAQLKAWAKENIDAVTELEVKVDSRTYTFDDLKDYRFPTDKFTYHLASYPSLYDAFGMGDYDGQDIDAFGDGYYLMLNPMSRGEHTVFFHAKNNTGFELNITYKITVQ